MSKFPWILESWLPCMGWQTFCNQVLWCWLHHVKKPQWKCWQCWKNRPAEFMNFGNQFSVSYNYIWFKKNCWEPLFGFANFDHGNLFFIKKTIKKYYKCERYNWQSFFLFHDVSGRLLLQDTETSWKRKKKKNSVIRFVSFAFIVLCFSKQLIKK